MNRKTKNNIQHIINAVLSELHCTKIPVELRGDIEQYLKYKLDVVHHAELHAGNNMFMSMLNKYEHELGGNPYEIVGDKMFVITYREVWFYSDEQPMTKLYSSVCGK